MAGSYEEILKLTLDRIRPVIERQMVAPSPLTAAEMAARERQSFIEQQAVYSRMQERLQDEAIRRQEERVSQQRYDEIAERFKIAHPEMTPELELRVIALGARYPATGSDPMDYLEMLLARAKVLDHAASAAPPRISADAFESNSTMWPGPRPSGYWWDRVTQEIRSSFTSAALPYSVIGGGYGTSTGPIVAHGGSGGAVTAREVERPKPVEIRVVQPTGKRRIDLDEE